VEGITNSQVFIDAYTWFANMHNEWAASPTGSIDAGELFRNGQLAIFIDGPWQIGQYVNEPLSFQGGAAPHPAWEGGEPMTPGDSWHVGVNAYTDHPEEAKAFVKFLTSEEIARYWYELWGVWPAHEVMLDELYASAEGAEFPESAYGVAAAEAPNTKPRPLTVGYLEYEQILSEAFEDIRNGADVTESLNLATERIQRELDKYKTQ
jgi:multiple sugar transport system substrate-binding protein